MHNKRNIVVALAAIVAAACGPGGGGGVVKPCSTSKDCPLAGWICASDQKCYPPGSTCKPACTGATPLCDTTTLSCVGCFKDSDCPTGTLCVGKSCKAGCSSTSPTCASDGGACDVDLGVCRGCLVDSECSGATPRCEPLSGQCVPCLPQNDNCPTGSVCLAQGSSYACASGCKSSADCTGMGQDCCKSRCVSVLADNNNCGACGTVCGAGKACCGGACVDYANDPNNCGGCGIKCAPQNATGMCAAGQCVIATCTSGFTDCDKSAANGCEVNTAADTKNCGACGTVCSASNATPACNSGTCAIASCTGSYRNCDNNAQNGCEIDSSSDPLNCNACGNVCPPVANGTAGCSFGSCGIASCNQSYGNCDGNSSNGCETNLLSNVNNCGSCGKFCSLPNATPACSSGQCTVAACTGTYANCNGLASDGCEINTATSASNCGACNFVCGTGQTCVNSVCTTTTTAKTYSASFTYLTTPSSQCTSWNTFRASLTGTYTTVRLRGSLDSVGVSCTGSTANTLCQALRNGTATGPWSCGGRSWQVGTCGSGIEISANGDNCQCSTGYIVRPCIANENWGGIAGATCSASSQTMEVICS